MKRPALQGGTGEPPLKIRNRLHLLPDIDPLEPPYDVMVSDSPIGEIYRANWNQIRTRITKGPLQKLYNFRLTSEPDIERWLTEIHKQQTNVYKMNVMPGFLLRNRLTRKLRYFYGSVNNNRIFPKPFLIKDAASFEEASEAMSDFLERAYDYAYQQKPNSSWIVEAITNVAFFVHPLPTYPIGYPGIVLPDYIVNNKGLFPLTGSSHGPITDKLCVFRCLALHNGATDPRNLEKEAHALFRDFTTVFNKDNFPGVCLRDLHNVEQAFNVGIVVYQLATERDQVAAAVLKRTPVGQFESTMKVCLIEESTTTGGGMAHFAYIHAFRKFAHVFSCGRCTKLWPTEKKCYRHERTCTGAQRLKYQGGVYHPTPTIFEQLSDEGVNIDPKDRIFPYRCTYDIECYLPKANVASVSGDFVITRRHIPMSVSVCSNVPGFEAPKNFVIGPNGEESECSEIIFEMVNYMESISAESNRLLRKKFSDILSLGMPMAGSDCKNEAPQPEARPMRSRLQTLISRFESYISELPCIGFNSARYDINVIKTILLPYLVRQSKINFVIKKQSSFFAIATPTLKFLDICNYLAPGYSYAKFLKAFRCQATKSHFPFDFVDSPQKLYQQGLPAKAKFFDSLHKREISDDDYQRVRTEWHDNEMVTLKDLLVHYNNRDVEPFVEALSRYCATYEEQGIDPFKNAISVPGLAFRELFTDIPHHFFLFDDKNSDLYRMVKENLVGGLSIILHRYHEVGITKIRDSNNVVRKIVGFDGNALYMGCTCLHDMPCGMFGRRSPENGFRVKYPRRYGRMMREWLDFVANKKQITIRHQFNATEKVLNKMEKPIRADGWCAETDTAYQFEGCYWHGHANCTINAATIASKSDESERATYTADLLKRAGDSAASNQRITDGGYNLVIMRECEWRQLQEDDDVIAQHCASYESPVNRKYGRGRLTEATLIKAIKDGSLFGMVECDIEVPHQWPNKLYAKRLKTKLTPREFFADLPPIMKHAEVTTDDIGPTMRSFVENNNLSRKPRKMLIASFFGKKILLATPMIQWLLNHGLRITRIHTVVEYERAKPFVAKALDICDARRAGDADPTLAILADMKKTTGNSFYGKSITAQEAQLDVKYLTTAKAASLVNSDFFRELQSLEDGDEAIHEVLSLKKFIKFNLPIQIGFFTYQLAKLRMLEFLYDCLDRYIDRTNYQLLESDTDSFYLAISGETIHDVIKPHLADEFYKNHDDWFPAAACSKHHDQWVQAMLHKLPWTPESCCLDRQAFDKRTPELFKVEWEGDGFVGLSSKTYYCWGGKSDKLAAKGVNKQRNEIDKETFLKVLQSQETHRVENAGFRVVNNRVVTYTQDKDGMTYNYWKRVVRPDGVTTDPLQI
jgi:G:T-mismatch repair DNA endonuclease (very short patch repair protein)